MGFVEIPKMTVLHGEEAIDLLNRLIEEFEQQKGSRLTEKQAHALTNAANQIILMIRGEIKAKPTGKPHISSRLGLFERFRASRLSR